MAETPVELTIETDVTWGDVRAFNAAKPQELQGIWKWIGGERWTWRHDATAWAMCTAALALLVALVPSKQALIAGSACFGALGLVTMVASRTPAYRRYVKQLADPARQSNLHGYVGPKTVRITQSGLEEWDEERRYWWAWHLLTIEVTPAALYFRHDAHRAVIVPAHSFPSRPQFEAICEAAMRAKEAAITGAAQDVPSVNLATAEFSLTEGDIAAAYLAGAPSWKPSGRSIAYAVVTAPPLLGMCPLWNPDWQSWVVFPLGVSMTLVFLFGGTFAQRRGMRAAAQRALETEQPALFSGMTVAIDTEGIHERTSVHSSFSRWTAIRSYEVTERVAAFHDGTGIAIVPERVFAASGDYFDFVEQALAFRRQALAA